MRALLNGFVLTCSIRPDRLLALMFGNAHAITRRRAWLPAPGSVQAMLIFKSRKAVEFSADIGHAT